MEYKIQLLYEDQNVNCTLTGKNCFDQLCSKIKEQFEIEPEDFEKTYILFSSENGKCRLITNEKDIQQILHTKSQNHNNIQGKDIIINIIKGNEELKIKLFSKTNQTEISANQVLSQSQNEDNKSKEEIFSNKTIVNINENYQNKEEKEEVVMFHSGLVNVLSLIMNSVKIQQGNNSQIEETKKINYLSDSQNKENNNNDDKNSSFFNDHHIKCNNCQRDIVGKRMKCFSCLEYNICNNCYSKIEEQNFHPCSTFISIINSDVYNNEIKQWKQNIRLSNVNSEGSEKLCNSIIPSLSSDSFGENINNNSNNNNNEDQHDNQILSNNKKDIKNETQIMNSVSICDSNQGNIIEDNLQSHESKDMYEMKDYKSQVTEERVKSIDEMLKYFRSENISLSKQKEQKNKEIQDADYWIEINNKKNEFTLQIPMNTDYIEVEIPFETKCKRITVVPAKLQKSNILSKVTKISMKEKKITFCFERMSTMHDRQLIYNYFCEVSPYKEDANLSKDSIPKALYQIILIRSDEK